MMRPRTVISVGLLLLSAGCMGSAPLPSSDRLDSGIPAPGHGVIEGAVVDQAFTAIGGATVRILDTAYTTTADSMGHFRFTGLLPGAYTLEVSALGWHTGEADVVLAGEQILRVTVFLDPQAITEPYSELRTLSGKITCAVVEAAGESTREVTCQPTHESIGFPTDWAATVTEVTWGPSGFSDNALGRVSLEFKDKAQGKIHVYQRITTKSPARLVMLPATSYEELKGDTPTPAQGAPGPLEIDLQKAPTQLVQNVVSVSATLEQSFTVYHTTFFFEAPADLESFSALPPP